MSFWGAAKLFSRMAAPFPPSIFKGSNFSTFLPTFICLFYSRHSSGYEGVSSCDFDLNSLMFNDIKHLFMCFWPFMYLWRNIHLNSLSILKSSLLLLNFKNGLEYKSFIGYMICKYFLRQILNNCHWLFSTNHLGIRLLLQHQVGIKSSKDKPWK